MNEGLALFIAVPIAGAAVCALFPNRLSLQRALLFVITTASLVLSALVVVTTSRGEVLVTQIGGWPPPFAIAFVADVFAALMLFIASLMIVACSAFAVFRQEDRQPFFHALVLVLLAGISGAFLTSDLFNLFVFFEVLLIASYVLLTLKRGADQTHAGAVYVTTNLFASTILLAGVGLVYAATGTVNMAALAESGPASPALTVGGAFLLIAFAVKSSLAPLHGWLPRSYPWSSPAVAALFSGLLTKVGIYALFRVFSLVFAGDQQWRGLILVLAGVTMVVGVLGAIGRDSMRDILSFHIVSQVGYMIMGLGLFSLVGLAGGIFYVLHHIVVKTSLFLAAGAVETTEGTGLLKRLGSMMSKQPLTGLAFVIAAFSLAGLPPSSGFFAKLVLLRGAVAQGHYVIAGVSLVVSFLTLASMIKIYDGVFAQKPRAREERDVRLVPEFAGGSELRWGGIRLAAPALALSLLSLAIGLYPAPVLELSEEAARQLLDVSAYVEGVLGS